MLEDRHAGIIISINTATPTDVFGTTDGKKMVANAFMVKYGIDVVKANAISRLYMDCEKL